MENRQRLQELVRLSAELGQPAKDYVILGEGNSSARENEVSFWVKASGVSLEKIDAAGFVQVRFDRILDMVNAPSMSDEGVKEALFDARINAPAGVLPSVETTFHAICLTEGGAQFVGHTHPTAVNSILCSQYAQEAYSGRLFPDEIVVCGIAPVFVPYTDPGIQLAAVIRDRIMRYKDELGRHPKLILMQNHGTIALGQTANEVLRITSMAVKTSRILQAAYATGGPKFLTAEQVARIDSRLDEHYRQRKLEEQWVPKPF